MTVAAAQVRAILRDAARLLWRHWPALLTLGLLGAAWRSGALWLAVIVSDHAGFAAQLLLSLAPIGYLLALVAMLRVCRPSLAPLLAADAATAPMAATERRPVRLLDIAVSILVPFLAAYIGYGLLEQDLARFTNVAAYDEFNQFDLTREVDYDFAGRLALYAWPIALAIMLGASPPSWPPRSPDCRESAPQLHKLRIGKPHPHRSDPGGAIGEHPRRHDPPGGAFLARGDPTPRLSRNDGGLRPGMLLRQAR